MECEFKMTVFNGKVDVLNYSEIDHFDDNMIVIRHKNGSVIIKGYHMIITKLLDDELLVSGKIEKIELR